MNHLKNMLHGAYMSPSLYQLVHDYNPGACL